MSDFVYSLAIEDDLFNMTVGDRPVWLKPSGNGLRFIPNDRDEIQDALIIFGHKYLDFPKNTRDQIIEMIEDTHKEMGKDALLEPWKNYKLLMLEAKNELKRLTFKGNLLLVTHEGITEEINFGCDVSKIQVCLAECKH